jgi:hypothetical protein
MLITYDCYVILVRYYDVFYQMHMQPGGRAVWLACTVLGPSDNMTDNVQFLRHLSPHLTRGTIYYLRPVGGKREFLSNWRTSISGTKKSTDNLPT